MSVLDILIVEDKPDREARLKAVLAAAGFEGVVVATPTAASAIVILEACAQLPRVILLDHDLDLDGRLPLVDVGNGTQVAVWLSSRRAEQRAECRVILSTKNPVVAPALMFLLTGAGYPCAWVPEIEERVEQLRLIALLTCGVP